MKRMKIALMAVVAIVMGTTFTSCLDSDNGPSNYPATGIIGEYAGRVSMTLGDGVQLVISNPEQMKFSFTGSENSFYPVVATIAYQEIEGQDYTEGKTSYNVAFAGYYNDYSYFFGGNYMVSEERAESLTPLSSLVSGGEMSGYICVIFGYYHKDLTFNDFSMYPYKWDNNKLYFKLVHNKAVDTSSTKTSGMNMCFRLPGKADLRSEFPDIVFSGEDQDTVDVMIVADGADDKELSLESSFKVKVK